MFGMRNQSHKTDVQIKAVSNVLTYLINLLAVFKWVYLLLGDGYNGLEL